MLDGRREACCAPNRTGETRLTATARTIARIVGPCCIALAVTERMNMDIFAVQTAPVVYLNGTLLLVGGVAILQAHNRWIWGWPLLVTLTGWAVAGLGLSRMIAPQGAQAQAGLATDLVFAGLVLLGAVLSLKGYGRRDVG